MVVLGVLPLSDAYAAIDFDVLVFLLGLMLIVGYLEVGKFFEWAAEWILARARTPERLLLGVVVGGGDRKSTRLNSSHLVISYAVFCLKKKKNDTVRSVRAASRAR